MKRIKHYVFTLFVITAFMCLTACGTMTRNGTTGTTGTAGTSVGTTTSVSGNNGPVDRAVDKVQEGVDNVTGQSNGQPTTATGRSSTTTTTTTTR